MLRIHLYGQNPYESIYGLEYEYISFFVIEYEYNYPWRDMDLSPICNSTTRPLTRHSTVNNPYQPFTVHVLVVITCIQYLITTWGALTCLFNIILIYLIGMTICRTPGDTPIDSTILVNGWPDPQKVHFVRQAIVEVNHS